LTGIFLHTDETPVWFFGQKEDSGEGEVYSLRKFLVQIVDLAWFCVALFILMAELRYEDSALLEAGKKNACNG
jgi:hypothetical protein